MIFITDAYNDQPKPGTRDALVAERNHVRMLIWQDPADKELRAEFERLEEELRSLDRR